MLLYRLIIEQHQQFNFLDIDLRYPKGHSKEGKPLDKICFIGKNGTGKTTLLSLINNFIVSPQPEFGVRNCAVGFSIDEIMYYVIRTKKTTESIFPRGISFYRGDLDKEENWVIDFRNNNPNDLGIKAYELKYLGYKLTNEEVQELQAKFEDKKQSLAIFSPSEVHTNELLKTDQLPNTNLNSALAYFNNFPHSHNISFQNVKGFWDTIIYQVKKRETDYQDFLHLEENKTKTIGELDSEFNRRHPLFLNTLSNIWNRILSKAGLYFDVAKAKVPMQLNDNLLVYIKLKSTNENITYGRLSSGIRHYIFRLGYVASLFFSRKIKWASVIIDEPENSLFPDLLFDLVEQYENVTRRTQFFYATHSPIIASQFEPSERVILDFDDNGNVITRKGRAAIGDEPNDVLLKDFGIQSLLGKVGKEKWERYIELKILIKQETNLTEKEKLTREFLEIGEAYSF